MAEKTLVQRIALDGGEAIRKELAALGKEGEAAFKQLQSAAANLKGPGPEVVNNLKNIQAELIRTGQAFRDAGQKMIGVGREFSKFITLPIVALGAVGVKAFTDFDAALAEVAVHIDTTKESISAIGDEIRRVAREAPVGLDDVAKGMSKIRDGGILASDAFKVLEGSAKLAVVSQTSVADASKIVTQAIKAFNLTGTDQAKVFDLLFRAAHDGTFELNQLGDVFGKISGTVQAGRLKLDEYLAALATLSIKGLGAAAAQKVLNTTIDGLVKGGKDVDAVFKKLGVTTFDSLVNKTGGLVQALSAIVKAAGKDQEAITNLFGSMQNYAAVLDLVTTQNPEFTKTLTGMRSGVDSLAVAFDKVDKTAASSFKEIGNKFNDVAVTIGKDITPIIIAVGSAIADTVSQFSKLPDPIRNVIEILLGGLAVIGPALVTLGVSLKLVGFGLGALGFSLPTLAAVGAAIAAISAPVAIVVGALALLGGGLFLLASNQSAAGKAADIHRKAMEELAKVTKEVRDGMPGSVDKLKALSKSTLENAQATLTSAKAILAEKDAILERTRAKFDANQTGPGAVNAAARDVKVATDVVNKAQRDIADVQKEIAGAVASALSTVATTANAAATIATAATQKANDSVTIIRGNSAGLKGAVKGFTTEVIGLTDSMNKGLDQGKLAFGALGGAATAALTPITGLKDKIRDTAEGVLRITDDTGKVLLEVGKDTTSIGTAIDHVNESVGSLKNTGEELKQATNIVGLADAANQIVIALQSSATQAEATAAAIIKSGQQAITGWQAVPAAIAEAAGAGAAAVQQIVAAFQTVGAQIEAAFGTIGPAVAAAFASVVAGITLQLEQLGAAIANFVATANAQLAQLNAAIAATQAAAQAAAASAPAASGHAGGGAIRGPGTSTSDSIWAKLSTGEWVIKAKAVRHYGHALFEALNSMRMPRPGFAMGGVVQRLTVPFRAPMGAPAFAGGGAVAGSGGRAINLTIGGESFKLNAPDETADRLDRFISTKRVRAAGRRPNWSEG